MRVALIFLIAAACGDNKSSNPADGGKHVDAMAIDAAADGPPLNGCYAPCGQPATPFCCVNAHAGGEIFGNCGSAGAVCIGSYACDPNASSCIKTDGTTGTCTDHAFPPTDAESAWICL